jgi:hypothetical protein
VSKAIWFAALSRTGVGNPRMSPVSREGWLVVATFVGCMVAGGLSLLGFGLADHFVVGIGLFVVLAIAGAAFFLWAAYAHGDTTRTVADYRAARVSGQGSTT